MTLNDIIDKRFQDNLYLAYDELTNNPNPNSIEDIQTAGFKLAREWTIDDMSMEIAKYIDDKRSGCKTKEIKNV